jgi:hypothetical protein
MVPFQGDYQFDAAARRHLGAGLRARYNSGGTKADSGSDSHGGYNTRPSSTVRHNSSVFEFLGGRERS